jgi:hypothetical protein
MAIGNAKNIIVGAGAVYLGASTGTEYTENDIPEVAATIEADGAAGTYQDPSNVDATSWESVGYTSEGVDLSFEPDYGEVQVDQLLDVAKIFKQGQRVMLNTSFTEGTLENLLIAIGGKATDLNAQTSSGTNKIQKFEVNGGALGYTPVERSILVVGPAPDALLPSPNSSNKKAERIYLGYRALSMDTVGVGVKRDAATVFPVSFRLLPSTENTATADGNALYGKIIDRVYG